MGFMGEQNKAEQNRRRCSVKADTLPNTSRDKDSQLAFIKNEYSNKEERLKKVQSHEASTFHHAAIITAAPVKEDVNVASASERGKQIQDVKKTLLVALS